MAFDQATRNLLARFVADARRLIAEEFTNQFRSLYGISDSGEITSLQELGHLGESQKATAARLRERIDYLVESHPDETKPTSAAVERLAREQAFTILNRLAAIRMAEKRGLIVESVGKGYRSKGFQVYSQVAGSGLGETYDRYRRYLFCLFDELAVDLGVLFDRLSPSGILFPREKALLDLIKLVNASDLEALWAEDETIGWIYQYYNDPAERKKMREKSAAPRNSYELAVRNQFFTPRYVVEFLTDNTLGRLWYEMTRGETKLKEHCRYLVCRPNEIFLKPGQKAPEPPKQDNLSQEELLKQPLHIPHRQLKDPRTILMLDPACGSMHFGLYAFDLFEVIYEEAWELEEKLGADALSRPAGMKSLHETFADKDAFLKDVPLLIIEHSLHGIDIDPRCVQIAGLSLWLRAQKAWQRLGLKPAERPAIKRSNIVCAEPMPGEKEYLKEFCESLRQPVIGQMVELIFDKMRLAGEAGSLLKIEEEIRDVVHNTKLRWTETYRFDQAKDELFTKAEIAAVSKARRSDAAELNIDFSGITDDTFWEKAEERIYAALRDYAEQAESGDGFQRRLFADDAARGFAFIDVCRKRYDVALMNPPFGEFSKRLHHDKRTWYPNTWQDILAAFTERFFARLTEAGLLGAITSRTGFFLPSLVWWRQEFLVRNGNPALLADLGDQVMDGATVESATYVIARCARATWAPFFRFLGVPDRKSVFHEAIAAHNSGRESNRLFCVRVDTFKRLRQSPFAYWVTDTTVKKLEHLPRLVPEIAEARQGLVTGDADRFVRVFWEVPSLAIETSGNVERPSARWFPYVMRGSSQPWYSPLTVVVNWERNGFELRNFFDAKGELRSRPRAMEFYFRPGFSWTRRAVRFVPYLIPSGCIPSASRYMAYPIGATVLDTLGLAASNIVSAILRFYGEKFAFPNFLVEHLKSLPWASAGGQTASRLRDKAAEETSTRRWAYTSHEPFPEFIAPGMFRQDVNSSSLTYVVESLLGRELDSLVAKEYGLTPQEESDLLRDLHEAIACQTSPTKEETSDADSEDDEDLVIVDTVAVRFQATVSYIVGVSFGRWDIQYATGAKAAPELPDPFAPLPVCPPGQLQNAQGLPARPEDCTRRVSRPDPVGRHPRGRPESSAGH